MKLEFSRDFQKISNIKFLKKTSSEPNCSVRTATQTEGRTDRQTDTTKLKTALQNFAKALKKYEYLAIIT